MKAIARRRFLTMTAGLGVACALPMKALASAPDIYTWRGIALGAEATLIIRHIDAQAIAADVAREIARLEGIFSLYQADSALSQLNTQGALDNPPFEMLELLSQVQAIHAASLGAFDPTIQPLWALYARSFSAGAAPNVDDITAARALVGWDRVRFDATAVTMDAGQQLTLNGIAQGYIADRVADLLAARGLSDILINTGELRAMGGHPNGGDWPVTLDDPRGRVQTQLNHMALASSAPLGTGFDAAGTVGHILDPRTGAPVTHTAGLVSVAAPTAAMADGLSTTLCVLAPADFADLMAQFPQARLVHASI